MDSLEWHYPVATAPGSVPTVRFHGLGGEVCGVSGIIFHNFPYVINHFSFAIESNCVSVVYRAPRF